MAAVYFMLTNTKHIFFWDQPRVLDIFMITVRSRYAEILQAEVGHSFLIEDFINSVIIPGSFGKRHM